MPLLHTIQKLSISFQKGAKEEGYYWNLYILFTQESKEIGGGGEE